MATEGKRRRSKEAVKGIRMTLEERQAQLAAETAGNKKLRKELVCACLANAIFAYWIYMTSG